MDTSDPENLWISGIREVILVFKTTPDWAFILCSSEPSDSSTSLNLPPKAGVDQIYSLPLLTPLPSQTDRSFRFWFRGSMFSLVFILPFRRNPSFMVPKNAESMIPHPAPRFFFFFTRNPAVNVSITRVVIAVTSAVLDSIRNLGEQALFWPKLNVKVCSRQANTMCKSSFPGAQVM